MKIDNFALTMHQTCPSKFNMRMNEHWTRREKSAALNFGGIVHEGLAVWYRTGDEQASLAIIKQNWPEEHPADDYRNLGKALEVMFQYTSFYPRENFQVVGAPDDPMVEVSFTLDTGMFLSCLECGPDFTWEDEGHYACSNCGGAFEPIEYGGIFDGLVEQGPHVYVLEHKTTSRLTDRYFLQYKPNNQVSGYVWAARKLSGRKVGGAIINAIGVYKSQGTKFERRITSRTEREIEEWLGFVRATAEEIQSHRRAGIWPMRTGSCMMYNICEYHGVCSLSNVEDRQRFLEQQYVQHTWDYENRD